MVSLAVIEFELAVSNHLIPGGGGGGYSDVFIHT